MLPKAARAGRASERVGQALTWRHVSISPSDQVCLDTDGGHSTVRRLMCSGSGDAQQCVSNIFNKKPFFCAFKYLYRLHLDRDSDVVLSTVMHPSQTCGGVMKHS